MPLEMGERERIAIRRRFVMEQKAHNSLGLDAIVDAWNAKCVAENRPEDCRARATIADDLKEGLRLVTAETKIDAGMYREMLTAKIEYALSRPAFITGIENGSLQHVDRLLKAASQLAALHGANMPTKIAETDSQGNDINVLTDEERAARVLKMFELARQRKLDAEETPLLEG